MSQDDSGKISIDDLKGFLIRLGFRDSIQTQASLAFQHAETGTLIVLSNSADQNHVRPADLLSVLMRLENAGLVDHAEIELIQSGRLPLAS